MVENIFEFTDIEDVKKLHNEDIKFYIQKPLNELYFKLDEAVLLSSRLKFFADSPHLPSYEFEPTKQGGTLVFKKYVGKLKEILCPQIEKISDLEEKYRIDGEIKGLYVVTFGILLASGQFNAALLTPITLIVIKVGVTTFCE